MADFLGEFPENPENAAGNFVSLGASEAFENTVAYFFIVFRSGIDLPIRSPAIEAGNNFRE